MIAMFCFKRRSSGASKPVGGRTASQRRCRRSSLHGLAVLALAGLIAGAGGCVSYQYEQYIYGVPIADPGDRYPLNHTTIGDVLAGLGAPDYVVSLDNRDLLVYRYALLQENSLSVGIPVIDVATGGNFDMSASGALTRSDVLTFFFDSRGTLIDVVFEKGTDAPYFKALFPK